MDIWTILVGHWFDIIDLMNVVTKWWWWWYCACVVMW